MKDKHPRTARRVIYAKYHVHGWPEYGGVRLYDPASMRIQRYRYRSSKPRAPWIPTHAVPA